MLATSDNDIAEALARLAARAAGEPASFSGVAARARTVLDGLGAGAADDVLVDGSGLSRSDRLSPGTLTTLLRDHQEGALAPGLPVAAATGSLRNRFDTSASDAAAGLARLKTGTLTGVTALAGYVSRPDGRLLALAFVDGSTPGGTIAARAALDRAVASLVSCRCAAPCCLTRHVGLRRAGAGWRQAHLCWPGGVRRLGAGRADRRAAARLRPADRAGGGARSRRGAARARPAGPRPGSRADRTGRRSGDRAGRHRGSWRVDQVQHRRLPDRAGTVPVRRPRRRRQSRRRRDRLPAHRRTARRRPGLAVREGAGPVRGVRGARGDGTAAARRAQHRARRAGARPGAARLPAVGLSARGDAPRPVRRRALAAGALPRRGALAHGGQRHPRRRDGAAARRHGRRGPRCRARTVRAPASWKRCRHRLSARSSTG